MKISIIITDSRCLKKIKIISKFETLNFLKKLVSLNKAMLTLFKIESKLI